MHLIDCINNLKRFPRTSWQLRGVASPESVAAHSFGVVVWAMIIAANEVDIDETGDLLRTIIFAAIHDFHESLIGDLTLGQTKALNLSHEDGLKMAVELQEALIDDWPIPVEYMDLIFYSDSESDQASRIVADADVLDALTTAMKYRAEGNNQLYRFVEDYATKPMYTESGRRLRDMILNHDYEF